MPHPWPRRRAVVPNLWRLWFTAFTEYPVLGTAVLRHRPAFTRFLLRHQVADPAVGEVGESEVYVAATRRSAHAWQSMFWQFVLREIPALVSGTARASRLTVPTLLLGGERDRVFPPSLLAGGERYADDLAVRIVPGAGHFLPRERPAVVAEALRARFSANGHATGTATGSAAAGTEEG